MHAHISSTASEKEKKQAAHTGGRTRVTDGVTDRRTEGTHRLDLHLGKSIGWRRKNPGDALFAAGLGPGGLASCH